MAPKNMDLPSPFRLSPRVAGVSGIVKGIVQGIVKGIVYVGIIIIQVEEARP